MKKLISLLAVFALLGGIFPLSLAMPAAAADTSGYAAKVLHLANAKRADKGLAALSSTSALNNAAQKRAEEIASRFSHTRPGGKSCFTVLDDYNIANASAGENIAYGQSSPAAVMDEWMDSRGHRKNILGDFDALGVGVCEKNGRLYWVQLFIREGTRSRPKWASWPGWAQWTAKIFLFGWVWM